MAYRTELLGFAINLVLDFIFDSAHHMYIGGDPPLQKSFVDVKELIAAGHQEQLTSLLC